MQQVTQRGLACSGSSVASSKKSFDIKPQVPFTALRLLSFFSVFATIMQIFIWAPANSLQRRNNLYR